MESLIKEYNSVIEGGSNSGDIKYRFKVTNILYNTKGKVCYIKFKNI